MLGAIAVRKIYEGLDHYVMLAKIKIECRLKYGRENGKVKVNKVLASERNDRKEVREKYERKVCKRLIEARLKIEEKVSVSGIFSVQRCSNCSSSKNYWV